MSIANSLRTVHLRRALLLFAIVLAMAALAASLSRPAQERSEGERAADPVAEPGPATAEPAPSAAPEEPLTFDAVMDESRRLRAGRAATLEVLVAEPGSVAIPALGLDAPADPLTPARFEVLPARPGDYEILFTPAAGDAGEPAGRLVVTSAG
jgi:hypothetical protein